MPRIGLFWRVLPFYALVIGLIVLPIYNQRVSADTLYSQTASDMKHVSSKAVPSGTISGSPSRLVVPALALDLKVVEGTFDKQVNQWTVDNSFANHSPLSTTSNNKIGKTLLYGHATTHIFGKNKNLKGGDKAFIYTENGHIFEYTFVNNKVIDEGDTGIYQELDGQPGLALMTCIGFTNEQRLISNFVLSRAN